MKHRAIPFLLLVLLAAPAYAGAAAGICPSAVPQEEGGQEQEEDIEDDMLDDGLDDLLEGGAPDDTIGTDSVIKDQKGFIELEFRTYFTDRNLGRNNEELRLKGEVEVDFVFEEGFTGYVRPRLFVDFLDEDLRAFEPWEAYVTFSGEYYDLRVGQFVENWGIVDTYNPIDILNRRDLRTDFLDPDRLGEAGLRARVWWEGGDTLAEPVLSLYVLPAFRETPFPTPENRFNFDQPSFVFDDDSSFDPDGFEEGLYALRFQGSLYTAPFNADFQLLAARGPERFPAVIRRGIGPVVYPAYFGAWTFGAGIRAVPNEDSLGSFLAKLTFKAEVVYKRPYSFDNAPFRAPDDYLAFVVGVDRIFNGLILEQDQLTLTVEYAGETGANDAQARFRPFRDDLIVRVFWEMNDFSLTSLEGRAIFDLKDDEYVWEIIFKRQLRFIDENLTFTLQVQGFEPARTGETLYDLFPDNTSILVGLRWNF